MPLPVSEHGPKTEDFPSGLKAVTLVAGQPITRVHKSVNGAVWYGPAPGKPPSNRFDAPGGQYRTMYAADTLAGAFAETILHRPQPRILTRAFVDSHAHTELRVTRPLLLAMLYGEGLLWHRQHAEISTQRDYAVPRDIACKLYLTYEMLHGIAYRSGHNNDELCYALFQDRCNGAFEENRRTDFSDCAVMIDGLVARYGAVYDSNPPLPPLTDALG